MRTPAKLDDIAFYRTELRTLQNSHHNEDFLEHVARLISDLHEKHRVVHVVTARAFDDDQEEVLNVFFDVFQAQERARDYTKGDVPLPDHAKRSRYVEFNVDYFNVEDA